MRSIHRLGAKYKRGAESSFPEEASSLAGKPMYGTTASQATKGKEEILYYFVSNMWQIFWKA